MFQEAEYSATTAAPVIMTYDLAIVPGRCTGAPEHITAAILAAANFTDVAYQDCVQLLSCTEKGREGIG